MSTFKVFTEKDLQNYAWDFVTDLADRSLGDKACVVFLQGDLGTGKTTFTKAVAGALNIKEEITSPTFVILKRYPIENMGEAFPFENLVHVDAYRLKSYNELEKIKFGDYLSNPKNLILLEWPEMVEHEKLESDIYLKFSYNDEVGKRVVEIG